MPLARDIASYLDSQTVWTLGTNIFVGELPDTPDACIAVYEYAGSPPDLVWEGEYPSCQVRVRAPAFEDAHNTADLIMATLHKLTYKTIDGTLYYYISAKGSPEQMGRDANKRFEFVINFAIIKGLG